MWTNCSIGALGTFLLPGQKLSFSSVESCIRGLLPRPENRIKGLRKIHPKINLKAKISCQELQPHTSCWLVLLPHSSEFWFFSTKRKPALMTWIYVYTRVSLLSPGMPKWVKLGKEESEVIGRQLKVYIHVYMWDIFFQPPELSELPPRVPALASLLWTGILFTVTGETHRELLVMKLCVAAQRKDGHLLYVWELWDRRRTCAAWKVRKDLGLYSRVGIWTGSQFAFWFEELLAQTSLAVLIMFHQT